MTFAYASPPPFRFGPADLKAHARKFLERALVISALVHLSAAGLFRAAQERAGDDLDLKIPGIVELIPHVVPPPPPPENWVPKGESRPDDGVIVPVNRTDLPPVTFNPGETSRDYSKQIVGEPRGGADGTTTEPGPTVEKQQPFTVVDQEPVPAFAPKPPYPEWAMEAGVEGKVILNVLVGTDGIPKNVVILSGPKALGQEAAKAIARWRFRPGRSGKDSVEAWVQVPVNYILFGR